MKEFEQDIQACVEVLRRGGLILYPTDTIWGIGCDATNAEAVSRVYALKRRADNKALIVLLDSEESLDHYVVDVPEMAYELLNVAVKPLTLIYEGAFNLAPNLLGENDSVGIRVPRDEFAHLLCERFGRPIVSAPTSVGRHRQAHSVKSAMRSSRVLTMWWATARPRPHLTLPATSSCCVAMAPLKSSDNSD